MTQRGGKRRIPFRSVNRPGKTGYVPGLQRHHVLPLQLLKVSGLKKLFEMIGGRREQLDDFRTNGLLLPGEEEKALSMQLPLHRGPHKEYNEVVIARVGQIERAWSRLRGVRPGEALSQVLMQLTLLQGTLRKQLILQDKKHIQLHRKDPLVRDVDYSDLDAMAEKLWGETGISDTEVESGGD